MILWVLLLLALLCGSLQAQEFCLVFSGEERGYLEPCGCARPQLGGIAKRHTFLKSLPEPWLAVSLGDLVGHFRRQDELKAETLIQALRVMDYSVHNLGETDLGMGLDVLAYLFPSGSVSLLSSNIRLTDSFIEIAPYKVYEVLLSRGTVHRAPTLKIGFLGILSPNLLGPPPTGVEVISPAEALSPLVKKLKDKVDVLVLLSHASMEESTKLARDFPEFNIVVSGHGIDHPVVVKEGNAWIVNPGINGKHLLLYRYSPPQSTFNKGGQGEVNGPGEMETITLDERFNDSDTMLSLLDNYQLRLKEENLLASAEKFPLSGQTSYAGSRTCNPCHPSVFKHWGSSPHAKAYETLLNVGRIFDPECVACHVVGFHYITGFQSQEKSPDLTGVGCEACHGPGSLHIAHTLQGLAEPADIKYGRLSTEDCQGCHDAEHGPPFHFESYWERIKHPVETPIRPAVIK